MPEITALSTEKRWYCRTFLATFLAPAAGRTSRELMTKSPTQVMDRVTARATAEVKSHS